MPLGRYQEIITAIITVFLVVVGVAQHVIPPILGLPEPTPSATVFVDSAALLALGATYGRISAANGYAKQARAANSRLDAIGAPPAADPSPAP